MKLILDLCLSRFQTMVEYTYPVLFFRLTTSPTKGLTQFSLTKL